MTRPLILALAALVLAGCSGGHADEKNAAAASQPEPGTSVRAVQVVETVVQPWIYGQGTARAVRREFLTFPTAGRVAYVDPKLKVGDAVRKGQLIAYQQPDRSKAELASARAGVATARTDLAVAEAAQREALANLELARETFERFAILLAKRSASQQEYDEAQARLASARAATAKADAQIKAIEAKAGASSAQLDQARVTVAESRIVAPIDGVLARLNIEQGQYFSPQIVQTNTEQGALSTVPVFIIDASAFEVTVDLPAYTIGRVSAGSTVLMSPRDGAGGEAAAEAAPPVDSSVEGTVYSITPSIDPEKRTFQVKARTSAADGRLHDGEFISIWIAGDRAAPAPAVPFDALRFSDGRPFVFVYDPASQQVERRELTLGARGRQTQAVTRGVRAGEWVVTAGRSGLADGDRVRLLPAESGASGPR